MARYRLAALLLCFAVCATAAADSALDAEIDHLLSYLAGSGCLYVRNGEVHTAAEAVAHITRKYEYFRSRIDSTEKFIELSASKSTMSGKPYTIRCPGAPEQRSRDWLLAELARYRDASARDAVE